MTRLGYLVCLCACIFFSVSVLLLLVGTGLWDIDVVCLILGENGKLSTESWQVKGGDLLIELLWKDIHLTLLVFIGVLVLPQVDLGEHLVCERARHDEGWMSSGASEVKKTSHGKNDDSVAIWEQESVNLLLDVLHSDSWV